jgi:anti-sigma-K factor RskA
MQELLPGYVLGALEADEMLAVDAYLQEHPEWQGRLHSLELAAASLAHAAPRAPLPARVKERLLAQVQTEQPDTAARPAAQPGATRRPGTRFGVTSPRSTKGAAIRGLRPIPPAQPQPVAAGPGWFGIFWRSVVAAGAVAAILLLALLTWQLRNSVASLAQQVSELEGQLALVQTENERLQATNLALQQQLQLQADQLAVLADPQQSIVLAGTEEAPTASGEFRRRGTDAVLILRGLSPLPANQSYQLWLLTPDGSSLPADLITMTDPTMQTVAVTLPPEQSDLVGVGISIEPAGGSQTPTTIVLLGTTPAPGA